MPDYQTMYTTLFNAVTDALEELAHRNSGRAEDILKAAQLRTEEQYISAGEKT